MYFLKTGFQASFQDLGRWGFQSKGINVGGVMDAYSVKLLNTLLQNKPNEAVIEMHFPAPELLFEEDAVIAIGGANFRAMLNGNELPTFKTVQVKQGSHLHFTQKLAGERAYLAVKGGFDLPEWLDSVSYHSAAKIGLEVKKGMSVKFRQKATVIAARNSFCSLYLGRSLHPKFNFLRHEAIIIRFVESVEYDFLTTESKQKLENQPFKISTTSNRMGYRLEGVSLEKNKTNELLSSAVSFGTMQLLPSGQIIILMADCQTTGGYPRIGSVCSVDLPILAQCSAHQQLVFQKIPHDEAIHLQALQAASLRRLQRSIHQKQLSF